MSRILHIANFNTLRLKGCFQCGFPVKISNGLIKNGHEVINYPERDLCRMFGFGHMNALGRWRLNKHLLKFSQTVRPDAVLIGHANNISNETLLQIKKSCGNIPLMQWNCDSIVADTRGSERNIKALNERLPVVDATMISTADKKYLSLFRRSGKPVAYLPNMADKAIETGRSFTVENLPYDAFLCANTEKRDFCGRDVTLEEIVAKSQAEIPEIKWLLAGICGKPALNGSAYLAAFCQAGIGFNLSRYNNVYLYSSDRLAHIMGNGQLALIDRRTGYNHILSEEGAAFYETPEEFFDKLRFFVRNPLSRMEIARNGYEIFYREFDNAIVTRYMTDILFGRFKEAERKWQIVL